MKTHIDHLASIQEADRVNVESKDRSYGSSWKKRGGVGAFMMAARKWDRLDSMMERSGFDVFGSIREQEGDRQGTDGTVLAEIRDLRRYLLLIEAEMVSQGSVKIDHLYRDYEGAEVPVGNPLTSLNLEAELPTTRRHMSPVHAADAETFARYDAVFAVGDRVQFANNSMSGRIALIENRTFDALSDIGWSYDVITLDDDLHISSVPESSLIEYSKEG